MIRRAIVGVMSVSFAIVALTGNFFALGGGGNDSQIDIAKLPPAASGRVDFAADVLPILRGSCIKCHGAVKQKGELRLDSRVALLKGGEAGKVILAGDSAHSALIHRVS